MNNTDPTKHHFICVCLRIVVSKTYCIFALCFCFICLRLVYAMLLVSLDCPIFIAPSLFSNVYLQPTYGLTMYVCILGYHLFNDTLCMQISCMFS
jgi:hypothetical protein